MLSLYLQYVKGLTPGKAGAILVTQPMVMALVAGWAGRLSDKRDPRILASLGMGFSMVGLLLLIRINAATPIAYLVFTLAILGFGFGLFSSPNTNSIMGSVDKRFLGVASGTVGTMRMTGHGEHGYCHPHPEKLYWYRFHQTRKLSNVYLGHWYNLRCFCHAQCGGHLGFA